MDQKTQHSVSYLVEDVARGQGVDSQTYAKAQQLVAKGMVRLSKVSLYNVVSEARGREIELSSTPRGISLSTGRWEPLTVATAILLWDK